jgi:hypothetical protein
MRAKALLFLFPAAGTSGCAVLTPLPPMPPPGPVTTPEQAISVAINQCGGWRTVERKLWKVRKGYESWIAEYDGQSTYSAVDVLRMKAIVDAPTGKLLNCIDETPVIVTAH